jgi:hypothetical protein
MAFSPIASASPVAVSVPNFTGAAAGIIYTSNNSMLVVNNQGQLFSVGNASNFGSMGGKHLNEPIVGIAEDPVAPGYWEVAADGGVFAFGGAHFYGSLGGRHINTVVVGLTPTTDGKGYWLLSNDGLVYPFGDATSKGSNFSSSPWAVGLVPYNNNYIVVYSDGSQWLNEQQKGGYFPAIVGIDQLVGVAYHYASGAYYAVTSTGEVLAFKAGYYETHSFVPDFPGKAMAVAISPNGQSLSIVTIDGQVFTLTK